MTSVFIIYTLTHIIETLEACILLAALYVQKFIQLYLCLLLLLELLWKIIKVLIVIVIPMLKGGKRNSFLTCSCDECFQGAYKRYPFAF